MPQELIDRVPAVIQLSSYSKHGHDRLMYYDVDEFYSIKGKVIEIETSGDKIIKVLIRKHYNRKEDLLVAVAFVDETWVGFVKTLWRSAKGSCRKNLNKDKYEQEGSEIIG